MYVSVALCFEVASNNQLNKCKKISDGLSINGIFSDNGMLRRTV